MDPFHLHFFLIHIVIEFGFLWQRNRLLDFGAYRMRKKWYVNEIPRAILTFELIWMDFFLFLIGFVGERRFVAISLMNSTFKRDW